MFKTNDSLDRILYITETDVSLQSTGVHKNACAAHDIHVYTVHTYLHGILQCDAYYVTNSLTAEYEDTINIAKPCKMV